MPLFYKERFHFAKTYVKKTKKLYAFIIPNHQTSEKLYKLKTKTLMIKLLRISKSIKKHVFVVHLKRILIYCMLKYRHG